MTARRAAQIDHVVGARRDVGIASATARACGQGETLRPALEDSRIAFRFTQHDRAP